MENIELKQGYGMKVYVDPDDLYIKPEWIDKTNHSIDMPKLNSRESNPVYNAYRELFKNLQKLGYSVITDPIEADEPTFFFSPCLDKHINKTSADYTSKKDKKIKQCLQSYGISEPQTVDFQEDKFPSDLPSLPFVLKNEDSQGGEEKFLIRTEEQLETLKKFYNEINEFSRKRAVEMVKKSWPMYPDLEFDEQGKSKIGICVNFIDYKKEFHENMRIQKYIKTPTEYNTSLRIYTSSSGDILCASLKYALPQGGATTKYNGLFDRYLSDPSSPYYLNSSSIVSNTIAGGNSILLDKTYFTDEEKRILQAHNIDPDDISLPTELKEACYNVATKCKREIGALCGMDFIFDREEQTWKYLEEHEFPMLYTYAEKYNFSYDPESEDFYTMNKLLDLRARVHALSLTMQKKYMNDDTQKTM